MGYRLRLKERMDLGLRRVVRELVRGAVRDLTGGRVDRHEGVHEARKKFKMIRAVLRLARGALGEEVYLGENTWYRDTGRTLSSVRDAVAMLEAYDGLTRRYRAELHPEQWRAGRRGLEERLHAIAEGEEGLEARAAGVAVGLADSLLRIRTWPLQDRGFKTVATGLERVYRQGRRNMAVVLREPTDEYLHEWRKRVKDHWYHVRLLRNVWPKVLDAYRREMKSLSDALGDDHDLAVLVPVLQTSPDAYGGPGTVALLVTMATRRRTELQSQSRTLGRRIYAERPSHLVSRFESRW